MALAIKYKFRVCGLVILCHVDEDTQKPSPQKAVNIKCSTSLWYFMKQQRQGTERTEKELPGVLMAPNTSVHPLLEAQLHSSTYIPFFTLATFS